MNEKDILAVALKHKLPMVATTRDGAWAYTEKVLAFGRDIAGEEWPEEHAFPPLPMSVVSHPALGSMYARFDLQMYAVQFERRSREAISAALGLEGSEAGNPDAILKAIEGSDEELKSMTRMFGAACADLGAINEALGLDPDAGGAAPILEAIASMKANPDPQEEKHCSDERPCTPCFADNGPCEAAPAKLLTEAQRQAISLAKSFMPDDTQARGESHEIIDALLNSTKPVACGARKQGTAGGNAPADCDWPVCGCDEAATKVIESLIEQNNVALTFAQRDVLKERADHLAREGFTNSKDDGYDDGVLAAAGAAYALYASDKLHPLSHGDGQYEIDPPDCWTWDLKWWKPNSARRALVKAASLLLAEIERIDRNKVKSKEASNG